jgi:hypothetical protein
MHDARARIGFGTMNVAAAIFAYVAVFHGLPARWGPIDAAALVVIVLMATSGLALLTKRRFAERLARIGAYVVLVIGMTIFAALALTASWLSGVYGPIGRGGALIFGLVAAMVLPYTIVLPAAELLWLGGRSNPRLGRNDPR